MNVTLHELLSSASWSDVATALRKHYPEDVQDLERYRAAFEKMSQMTPEPSSFRLNIESHEPDEDDARSVAVSCTDGSFCEHRRGESVWGLDFRKWAECLGMEVPQERRVAFTDAEVVAHCLWDLTWHGFDEADGQEYLEELQQRAVAPEDQWLTREEFGRIWDLE